MELKDTNDGWYLELHNGLVQLIQIDFRLGLFLSDLLDKAQLYVETKCRLKSRDADVSLTPADPSSLAPMLPFFNAKVAGVAIRKTGQLRVDFGADRFLEVDPDGAYEAWQLSCSTGIMLVCSPGGSVSLFRDSQRATGTTNPGANG
jgi:hypothetical protein